MFVCSITTRPGRMKIEVEIILSAFMETWPGSRLYAIHFIDYIILFSSCPMKWVLIFCVCGYYFYYHFANKHRSHRKVNYIPQGHTPSQWQSSWNLNAATMMQSMLTPSIKKYFYVDVWQKPTKFCKAIFLQLKNKLKKKSEFKKRKRRSIFIP